MSEKADEPEIPMPTLYAIIGAQCALFAAVGLGLWLWSGHEAAEFVTFDARQVALGLGMAAAMIGLGYILFKGFPKFGEKLVRDQVPQFPFLKHKLGIVPILFISACAGIGEEALFRGGLLTFGADYMPLTLAVFLTSIIFALVHLAKPAVASLITLIGALFALAYLYTGSLLAVMIGHAVYDVWALWFIQEEMHRLRVFDEQPHAPTESIDVAAPTD